MFYKIENSDGKCWLMPVRNVRMGLALYQPSGWKGRLLKRWFPYVHWSKVVRRKLNIEVVEHVLEEDLKRVIGSAFGVGGFEYSVFEGTPSVHQKITIQVWKGERILGYVKVTRSEEVGRLFFQEMNFLKKITDNRLQITDDSQRSTVNSRRTTVNSQHFIAKGSKTDGSTVNITPFGRDFCSAQHSTSKLDSAFAYRKKSTVNGQRSTVNGQQILTPSATLVPLRQGDNIEGQQLLRCVPEAVALRLESGSWILIQSTRKTLRSKVVHEWGALQENFLKRLYDATAKEIVWEESDVAQALRDLRGHVDWLPMGVDGDVVARRIDAVMERMAGKRVRYGAYHGDFTPWNMFVEGGELFVFDWEYAGRWYPMGLDRYHFWMQTAVFEKHWGVAELKRYMGSDEGKWIDGEMLEMYVLDVMSKYVMREGKRVKELGMFGVWATVNGQ